YFNREEALALSQRVIGLYTLSLNASTVQLNVFARRALSKLTATFDPELYEGFLDAWGTHIITKSLLSGMIEERAKVMRCSSIFGNNRFVNCMPFDELGLISSNVTYYSDQIRVNSKRLLGGNIEINNENECKIMLAVKPTLL
ncbi:unnamed protein product, partial [Rotaria magnacalcarata]